MKKKILYILITILVLLAAFFLSKGNKDAYVLDDSPITIPAVEVPVVNETLTTPPVVEPEPEPESNLTFCEQEARHTEVEYVEGWKKAFMAENNLSQENFSDYVSVQETALDLRGEECEFSVRYTITKDWIEVSRKDNMFVTGEEQYIPDNLPIESSLSTVGRIGVSSANVTSQLILSSQEDAAQYYLNQNSLEAQINNVRNDFEYFWNIQNDPNSVGQGGEPLLKIDGTINAEENKCFSGNLYLVSGETTYLNTPCSIS